MRNTLNSTSKRKHHFTKTILTFLLSFLFLPGIAQQKVILKKAKKTIEFIDFKKEENKNFRINHKGYFNDLNDYIFDKINFKEVSIYKIKNDTIIPLAIEDLNNKSNDDYLPFADSRNLPYIGLEKISGLYKRKPIHRFTYAHFYSKNHTYYFSIKYADFRKLIVELDQLYTENQNGIYWGNNLFLSHGVYSVDYMTFHNSIKSKIISDSSIKVFNGETHKRVDNTTFSTNNVFPNIYFIDRFDNGQYLIDSIGYKMNNYDATLSLHKHYIFKWDEKILPKQTPKIIYKLEDAIEVGLYTTSKIITIDISENRNEINYFDNNPQQITGLFTTEVTEEFSLFDSKNHTFKNIYPEFYKLLINLSLTNKIDTYNKPSEKFSFEEINKNFTRVLEKNLCLCYEYSADESYKKGDLVISNKTKYEAKEPIPASITEKKSLLPQFNSSQWAQIPYEQYDVSKFENIELTSEVTFDENGDNVTFELKYLTIFVPHDTEGNTKEIQTPIATYKWNDIKKHFPNNEFIAFMEKREFIAIYLRSRYFSIKE